MELKLPGALKPPLLEATLELLLNTSLNTVECLNHRVPSQLAQCLLVKPLVNSHPKVVMVVQPSLPANMPTPKCMVDLPVLVVTVVVSQHQMLNGVLPRPKTLETALVATKDSSSVVLPRPRCFFCCLFAAFSSGGGHEIGICFLHLVYSLVLICLLQQGRSVRNLHRTLFI